MRIQVAVRGNPSPGVAAHVRVMEDLAAGMDTSSVQNLCSVLDKERASLSRSAMDYLGMGAYSQAKMAVDELAGVVSRWMEVLHCPSGG